MGTCSRCGKKFFDPQSKELAFTPYEPLTISGHMLRSLYTAVGSCVFPPLILTLFVKNDFSVIWALCISAAFIFLLSLFFRLLTRKNIEKRRRETWDESDRRLRDLSYATLLKQAGWYIPGRYLPCSDPDFDPEPISIKPVRIVQTELRGRSENT